MTVSRRDALIMMGAAAAGVVLPGLPASAQEAGAAVAMAETSVETAAAAVAQRSPIQVISVHNFLYSDRHERLHPNLLVYLEGDPRRVAPFIECLERNLSADEIKDALGLEYRGDVWFATLLVHLHKRDGLVDLPQLNIAAPAELSGRLEKLENDWLRRNDPPKLKPWESTGPKAPPPPPPISFIEEEIEALESLRDDYPKLGAGLDKIIQRRRDQIAERRTVASA